MRLIKSDTMWNDPFAEMDYFLNRSFGSPIGAWFDNLSEVASRSFRIDSFQDDDNYYVVAELPGLEKDEVSIELENAVLTISTERKNGEGDNAQALRSSRSVTVGNEIDAEKVTAKLENGLLAVTLPKSELRKPRAITVA